MALVVEYDGSRYHGFQYQTNAPTIQGELEAALNKLTGESIRVVAASRTDAGVHARGQVVSFHSQANHSPQVWVKALNYYLPREVSVRAAYRVGEDFDVRRHAASREYCYFILNQPTPSPVKGRFTYFCPHPLNIEAMNLACRLLHGERDLASFTPARLKGSVRTVYEAVAVRKGEMVVFRMRANSFLPHQVRHTVGALLRVGLGRLGVEDFQAMARARRPGLAGPALPSDGLFLMKVHYPRPLGEEE